MTAFHEPFVNSSPRASQGALGLVLLLGCCTGCGDSGQNGSTGTTGEPACIEPAFVNGLPDTWRSCGCGMGPWYDACPEETHACMYQHEMGTTDIYGDILGGTCLQRCLRDEDCTAYPSEKVYAVQCDKTWGVCAIPCGEGGCPEGMTCAVEGFLDNNCLHNFSPG